jgi:6,7-dimethyl-8-ribityllumazine synthase
MAIDTIAPDLDGSGLRIGIVQARFNEWAGAALAAACLAELRELGVDEDDITHVTVPGALEVPLALAKLAQADDFDALIAIGCVIRGETYHFEVVANESARGVARVALDYGVPVANAILTTDDEEQARARVDEKGRDAARVAVEMANLMWALDEDGESDDE